ncbi:O-glycosyl hydrolase [Burkholderiales bacterium JOSHI_001]|nr:O-glycosyl hydrolase [Burkholderiales bacterium JOSHI_001]
MTSLALTRFVLSARDSGLCLADQPLPLHSTEGQGQAPLPKLVVHPEQAFQSHLGFGGAFTEAAATVWQDLPETAREQLLRDYFDPVQGHGYTLGRVHINSCDFALGHYAHVEQADDFALASFSIERDRCALLPFIHAAQRVVGRPLQLLASPWSPPAWMKTNGRMADGGRLRPECRAAWAQCFVRFIRAYQAEGVPIWGVSVQNEPAAHQRWDSCLYSAEEERDFVRDHLGPALRDAGLGGVKILVWDHNRDLMVQRASVVYADPEAAAYVWGTGFHWYGPEDFDQVQQLHDAWPDKQLMFTEGCQEGGPHADPLGSWAVGERYARNIIADLNRWTVGWIDWNLLLDERGGPNHVGNFCSAPILADTARGTLMHQGAYWVLGHFARFIRPGARHVLTDAGQAMATTAFVNPDGTLAVVASHPQDHALGFALCIGDRCTAIELPPRSIATFLLEAA